MRVVFWGGPWDDRAVDIPDPLPATWLVAAEYAYGDRAPTGDPLLGALMSMQRPPPFAYRMIRCRDAHGLPTVARRRGAPPTWPVYVPAAADDATIGRWMARASRPVVDGPRSALRVLVDRETRRQARARAKARIAARGPLP